MTASALREKACLICIDGWGICQDESSPGDAIRLANTPIMSGFEQKYPYTQLAAHGLAVGLPEGLMGNSEVGHLNIGAGRVVYQDIVRIDLAVKQKRFGEIENIVKSLDHAKNGTGRIHFLGLEKTAKAHGVPNAYIHFFGDGRDTDPRSSDKYLTQLQKNIEELGYGQIATIVGRYYAMDRDKRWERLKLAVDALVQGIGEKTDDPLKTIHERFAEGETDEFLKPIIVAEEGRIRSGDTLFFFNFRADRMRQIVQTLGISAPADIQVPDNLHIISMTKYKTEFPFPVAFPSQSMTNVLAEWLSKHKIPQCHVAETEKYAHVTFFFNGGVEKQFELEHRDLIPSPKVATYDLMPEMSANGVAEKVAEELDSGKYPFVMCNFANPDMVGHTGVLPAAINAVEATDNGIQVIYEACKRNGYILFITADHGNAEQMIGESGNPHTAHTCNPVPFVLTSRKYSFNEEAKGALCDVAPTILDVMGLEIPEEMTGTSLIKH
ncbi:4966_t:CDS:2 [Paraglomus brasilianum]|uniref:phosphoglycerate mutase (2,3-diphosphoglycerate-independent) n=1 Tax=Paraglomus brasilianum TaxID=144538 RepID=A0A9N9GLQ9_9GLOM|nr:4966_t:CDS:2 [Paraglomus brasilianum]